MPARPASHRTIPLSATNMSKSPASPRELIDRLDARHDELIERLDELNAQIERALAQVYRARGASTRNETAGRAADADASRAA